MFLLKKSFFLIGNACDFCYWIISFFVPFWCADPEHFFPEVGGPKDNFVFGGCGGVEGVQYLFQGIIQLVCEFENI